MNSYKRILLDPAGGDGGGGAGGAGGGAGGAGGGTGTPPPNAFLASLPEDLRADPVFKNIADLPTLAKGYKHAQTLIGAKRLEVPGPNWDDNKWGQLYDELGRPKTAADYKVPEFTFEKGLAVDEKRLSSAKEALHKAGLNQRQADEVMKYYFGTVNEEFKGAMAARDNATMAAATALKTEWGQNYDNNVQLAKAVAQKFGGPDFMKYLEESGLGNDPKIISAFQKIGTAMMDSKEHGAGDEPLVVTDAVRAQNDIKQLKGDANFMKALQTRSDPGHKLAVERWTNLHKIAAPGQVPAQ